MKLFAFALAGTLGCAAAAHAQSRHGLELGVEGQTYRYEEAHEGATLLHDRGALYGLTLGYARPIGAWELRLDARAVGGGVDYEASEGDRLEDVPQATVQLEARLGRTLALAPDWTLIPFVGLGFRGHGDDSGGRITDSGLAGYDRYVGYAYAPLGAAAEFRAAARTTVTLTAQYNLFMGGDVESRFSDIDAAAPDIEVELEEGRGWALSAAVNTAVGTRTVSFGPFYRSWDIEESTHHEIVEGGEIIELFEPSNTTREAGVRLSVRF